jgi:hypothetical protein
MSIAALTLRTWLRYFVPLTIVSAIAFGLVGWIAVRTGGAHDVDAARAQLRLGWTLVGVAWVVQLVLVAGVAPAVRSVASRSGISQLGALTGGISGLVHGVVPCLVAVLAIAIGSLALVIPGLLLLVMLAMTGASERLGEPLPAPLTDSVAAARGNFVRIAVIIVLLFVVDLAIGGIAQLAIARALKPPTTTAALLATRTFVRVIAASLILVSPLPACALAAAYQRRR